MKRCIDCDDSVNSIYGSACSTCTYTECLTCTDVDKVVDYDGKTCVTLPDSCNEISTTSKAICKTCYEGLYWSTADS